VRLAPLALVPLIALANGKISGTVAFTARSAWLPTPKITEPWCRDAGVVNETVELADGGKALANVVVYVEGPVDAGAPVAVTMDRCAFTPHVAAAASGTPLTLSNRDPVLHNVKAVAKVDGKERMVFDVALPQGTSSKKATRGELLKLSCELHPWETSYLLLSPGPAAVSDASGAFELSVPPGTYTVYAWHERYGQRSAKVTVEEGTSVDPKLSFSDHP
jgi:hypothetical protein